MQEIATSQILPDNVAVSRLPPARRLSFVALVGVIFFTVCGGAFGIEPLFGKLGAGWAIVLIVVTPLFWSIPISLMVSELAAMMPVEGGYYVWVKRALGDFWGFQEGWWTCLYSAVDMAIYPVLFVNYLAFFLPMLQPDTDGNLTWNQFLIRWAIAVAMIFLAMFLNWRGAKAVGYNSVFFLLVIIVPFVLLSVFGFTSENGGFARSIAAVRDGFSIEMTGGLFAAGLATVMWNYSGWDNVSTYAGEVNDASRNYPRALFATMGLAIIVYLVPTFALVGTTTDPDVWNESAGFPALAEQVGGPVLGAIIAVAALVSAWSLFNSQILYASRLPFAMAEDGWFPRFLSRANPETGVPNSSLVICCLIAAIFAALPFGKLVVMDIILYSSEILLEFVALIVLRKRLPDAVRPFRIPGGMPVLVLITILPMLFAGAVVWATLGDPETDSRHLWVVVAGLASGVAIYYLRRKNVEKIQAAS
ncbi:MAG: APC family permease [Pyrinomonadaceae bacterium]